MCGIAGIARSDGIPVSQSVIEKMAQAMIHRGPDDEGFFYEHEGAASIGMGFRRLSIIDVAGGHQPMRRGPWTIVFNGEIYNFKELKAEAEQRGRKFKTNSDTEVILDLFEEFGETALTKLNGMFALALWNSKNKELILARDRAGIKPLYYVNEGGTLAFASEMKSLYQSGSVSLDFDPKGLGDFFSYRFVPSPHTVLKSVKKVSPASFIRFHGGHIQSQTYWNWPEGPIDQRPYQDIEKTLETLIEDSVKSQMVSDVPLGAFLSGGVDSSLIAAFMVHNTTRKVKTFSIGFENKSGVDESPFARQASKYLGTEHHELILTDRDLHRSEKIFSFMNEPVADPTILPTAILSEFARSSVKVALTGEGADELFGGYNRYKEIRYPFLTLFKKTRPEGWFPRNRDFPPHEIKELLPDWSEDQTYISEAHISKAHKCCDSLNEILSLECQTALVDRLLMKVDMASMSSSLEARPPYLDHRVIEYSMKIPAKYKIRMFKGKYILRQIAGKYLPQKIYRRRKHGFIVPIWDWIGARGPDWLASIIEPSFLKEIPFLDRNAVQKRLEKSYNNFNRQEIALLWPLAVLAMWRQSLKKT